MVNNKSYQHVKLDINLSAYNLFDIPLLNLEYLLPFAALANRGIHGDFDLVASSTACGIGFPSDPAATLCLNRSNFCPK
jgi:hypothetical protein